MVGGGFGSMKEMHSDVVWPDEARLAHHLSMPLSPSLSALVLTSEL